MMRYKNHIVNVWLADLTSQSQPIIMKSLSHREKCVQAIAIRKDTIIQVYTAIDSKEAAQKIALAIVSQRLAACCWVSGPITSTYWWEGKVEQAEEWVCTMKTRKALFN